MSETNVARDAAFYEGLSNAELIAESEALKAVADGAKDGLKLVSVELTKRLDPEADKAFGETETGTQNFALPGSNTIMVKAVRSKKSEWDTDVLMKNLAKFGAKPFDIIKVKASVGAADAKAIRKTNPELAKVLDEAETTKVEATKFSFTRKDEE